MARRPFFMGNSLVGIRLLDRAAPLVDPLYGTRGGTVEAAYGEEIRVPGQPRFENNKRVDARFGGDAERLDAYVMFARDDLERREISPEALKGARVTGYMRNGQWYTEEFEVISADPTGHLPTTGPILVKAKLRSLKDLKGAP
jgi:hypothetical protein